MDTSEQYIKIIEELQKHVSAGIGLGDHQWKCKCGFHTWNYLLFRNHLAETREATLSYYTNDEE